MRCPRCHKKVSRKRWKNGSRVVGKAWNANRTCPKCRYTESVSDGYRCSFTTAKYVVFIGKGKTEISIKRSNQMVFIGTDKDGMNQFYYDCLFVMMVLNRELAANIDDVDIEKYMALQ